MTWTELGRLIGRHRCTIQREVARNGGRDGYRAGAATARAVRLHPCRPAMLSCDRGLAAKVAAHLTTGYSPAGTAHLLGGVCTETIYQGVYTGELGVKACDVLRSRRHARRRRGHRRTQTAAHFLGAFTSIHDRPAAVTDRAEFGHWEAI